jgi:transcriptional regulator with XRE-family HTH domain
VADNQKFPWLELGSELGTLRKARDIGQKQIADLLGESLNERLLRAFERGEKRPDRDRLLRLLTGPFEQKSPDEINRCLELASYAPLSDKEIQKYSLGPKPASSPSGHGTLYRTPERYTVRLTELVTESPTEHSLNVAIGEADFLKGWLARLMQASTGHKLPAISRLVILSLDPSHGESLEKQGRLRSYFTKLMVANVEAIRAELSLPVEHRVWPGQPGFHGYLYGDIALCGPWESNELGHLHVKTPISEFHRDVDPIRFEGFARAFRTSPLADAGD